MIADEIENERPILRDSLIALVERELLGPSSEAEILKDNPQKRYVCGQLAPLREDDLSDEDQLAFESLASANESDVIDSADESAVTESASAVERNVDELDSGESSSISKARRESLTSVGISFAVQPGQVVEYRATWGEYARAADGSYVRTPHEAVDTILIDNVRSLTSRDHGRVSIRWVVRAAADRMIASVFLGNKSAGTVRDGTERIYQVNLTLRCSNDSGGFLTRSVTKGESTLEVNELLYRDRHEFGVGLNIAVQPCLVVGDRCFELRTSVMPAVETRVTESDNSSGDNKALSMPWLAEDRDRNLTCDEISALFLNYRIWMEDLRDQLESVPARYRAVATAQVVKIADRLRRISNGIELLRANPSAFLAFRFANEAMSRAQYRSRHRAPTDVPMRDGDRFGSWRPFQIAFLVSSIADIVHPDNPDRSIVDVLFFPTGGGKTEAYLGLSAFAMAYRRMTAQSSNGGAGVSTLMRYTLRLLTTQQFSRAASLICAAETIRRSETFGASLGGHPFGIGLWVGPMTPNKYSDAVIALKAGRNEHLQCPRDCKLSHTQREFPAKSLRGRSPANVLPITECPWCFSSICIDCVELDDNAKRLVIRCPNGNCTFSRRDPSPGPHLDGLPVFIVDEDVYRMTPTIVVATVDKFATLPFRGEAKALFGFVSAYCEDCGFLSDVIEHSRSHNDRTTKCDRHSPADIVIQDELHTITDNLGSIYGLYETAIDFLLTRGTVGPKYICATATVKDVSKQISDLYGNRRAEIFPPSGFDAGDTFFSRDRQPTAEHRGRTYVGIYAPAFSRLSLFVAVLSALLSSAKHARDVYGDDASDPYMTLLGYFNTVRDLGGVKALLGDDVPPVLEAIAERNSWAPRILVDWENELTGRIAANEVPERLRMLDTQYREGVGCDFMAATNMISVGVDVPRLGIMLVDGQPKSTSEYIQATSRVGRSQPGVVFVVFNSMRPRDVSHYEHFYSYHDALYKFVEAGSITPFSDGAVDRYLGAALVACYRMRARQSDNDSASNFGRDPDGIVNEIIAAFESRAEHFGQHEVNSATSAIEQLVQQWRTAPKDLKYYASANPWIAKTRSAPPPKVTLKHTVLRASDDQEATEIEAIFSAPRSMRSVESDVPLLVRLDG